MCSLYKQRRVIAQRNLSIQHHGKISIACTWITVKPCISNEEKTSTISHVFANLLLKLLRVRCELTINMF